VLVVAAAVAVILFAALGRDSGSDATAEVMTQEEAGPTPTQVVTAAEDKPAPTPAQDQPAVEAALVTLEEFGDFQCSHCAQFALGMGKQVKEDFVDTSRIRFVFRHFPFIGEESFRAAEATECAADQEKFWEYHDTVFENWKGVNQGAYSDDNLKGFASTLQLDRDAFDSCLDSGKYRGKVEEDLHLGERLGVNSTPSLFLEGRRIQAASYSELKQLIESAIAAAR
jgi:protein-disulfide isomerase